MRREFVRSEPCLATLVSHMQGEKLPSFAMIYITFVLQSLEQSFNIQSVSGRVCISGVHFLIETEFMCWDALAKAVFDFLL